jgi:hypothetical protein
MEGLVLRVGRTVASPLTHVSHAAGFVGASAEASLRVRNVA